MPPWIDCLDWTGGDCTLQDFFMALYGQLTSDRQFMAEDNPMDNRFAQVTVSKALS